MNKFKVGDKVISKGVHTHITVGKIYEVLEESCGYSSSRVKIIDDLGVSGYWHPHYFEQYTPVAETIAYAKPFAWKVGDVDAIVNKDGTVDILSNSGMINLTTEQLWLIASQVHQANKEN